MPAAAAAAKPAEQRRDGVAESHTVIQTHRKDGKGLLKVPNVTEKWRPHAAQPTRMKPEPETIDRPRHARRPSAKAKKVGKRRATDLGWACRSSVTRGIKGVTYRVHFTLFVRICGDHDLQHLFPVN